MIGVTWVAPAGTTFCCVSCKSDGLIALMFSRAVSLAVYLPADELGPGELHLDGRIYFSDDRKIASNAGADHGRFRRVAANFIDGVFCHRESEVSMEEIKRIPNQIISGMNRFDQHRFGFGLLHFSESFSDHFLLSHVLFAQNDLQLGVNETSKEHHHENRDRSFSNC